MRVQSPLADIDFAIGGMRRDKDRLVFTSDASSSLEATVYMDAGDAAKLLGAFFKSPSAMLFALSLPYLWLRGGGSDAKIEKEKSAHPFDELNRPW